MKFFVGDYTRIGGPGVSLCELEGDGILGMCICHETDHLDGIVYIDKMIEDVTDQYEEEAEDEE